MQDEIRTCRCCNIIKPLSEYHKDNSKKDGYRTLCKSCVKQYSIDNKKRLDYARLVWYDKNKEKIKSYDAARYKANAEEMRKRSAEYKKNNPAVVNKYKEANKGYMREYSAAWYKENKDRLLELRHEYRLNNLDKIREATKQHYRKNKDQIKARHRSHHKNNRHMYTAASARRRAAKFKSAPKWADLNKINLIYRKCYSMCLESGVKYHVDHIVPLQSKFVCGLHCEYNLQILTEEENLSKSNSYWYDMPNYSQNDIKELIVIREKYEKESINI